MYAMMPPIDHKLGDGERNTRDSFSCIPEGAHENMHASPKAGSRRAAHAKAVIFATHYIGPQVVVPPRAEFRRAPRAKPSFRGDPLARPIGIRRSYSFWHGFIRALRAPGSCCPQGFVRGIVDMSACKPVSRFGSSLVLAQFFTRLTSVSLMCGATSACTQAGQGRIP